MKLYEAVLSVLHPAGSEGRVRDASAVGGVPAFIRFPTTPSLVRVLYIREGGLVPMGQESSGSEEDVLY